MKKEAGHILAGRHSKTHEAKKKGVEQKGTWAKRVQL